jgi:hypothetical protein
LSHDRKEQQMSITKGVEVRILINAGLIEHPEDSKFSGTAPPYTVGSYVGPHPSMSEDGWHLIAVGDLLAPLHEEQFVVSA